MHFALPIQIFVKIGTFFIKHTVSKLVVARHFGKSQNSHQRLESPMAIFQNLKHTTRSLEIDRISMFFKKNDKLMQILR